MSATSFTFSLGDSILAKVTGAARIAYIDTLLAIPLSDVPIASSIAVTNRILDLGTAISSVDDLTCTLDSLFGVVKINGTSYKTDDFATTLYLDNESSISQNTIDNLNRVKKLTVLTNYAVTGLNYTALTALETLIMRDGTMTDTLRTNIANRIRGCKHIEISNWGSDLNVYFWYAYRLVTITIGGAPILFLGFGLSENLTSVSFPSTRVIDADACFYMCTSLTSVSLPALTTIKKTDCFYMCTSLTSLSLPALNTLIGNLVYASSKLTTITFSDQITNVDDDTFYCCSEKLVNLCLVGQKDSSGHVVSNVVNSLNRLNSVIHKLPALTTFTFFVGDSILANISESDLVNYVNTLTHIPLSNAPMVSGVAAANRILEVGARIPEKHVEFCTDPLFGYIRVNGFIYKHGQVIPPSNNWIPYQYELYLDNRSSIDNDTVNTLSRVEKLTILKNYDVGGLDLSQLLGMTTLIMRDGTMTSELRQKLIQRMMSGKLICLEISDWGTEEFRERIYPHYLVTVTIGGVSIIDTNVFHSCAKLKSISLPALTTISTNTLFGYDISLSSISLPAVTTITSDELFYDCESLTSVSLPQIVTMRGSAWFKSSRVELLTLSDQVERFERSVFLYAPSSLRNLCLVTQKKPDDELYSGYYGWCDRDKCKEGIINSCERLIGLMDMESFTVCIGDTVLAYFLDFLDASCSGEYYSRDAAHNRGGDFSGLIDYVSVLAEETLLEEVPLVSDVAQDKRILDISGIKAFFPNWICEEVADSFVGNYVNNRHLFGEVKM
jgi:hypothetical protein